MGDDAPGPGVFTIEVASSGPPRLMPDATGATGRITIGTFTESFFMDGAYWSPEQYVGGWRAAVAHLLDGPPDAVSSLVSSLTGPATTNFVFTWP